MCGYSGFVFTRASGIAASATLQERFFSAAESLAHRGNEPMRSRCFANLLLSHVRLAFQDVAHGAQPLSDSDHTWIVVFNGEIYNFQTLRTMLKQDHGYRFRTHSDTEVLLACFLTFGEGMLERIEGEYSFVFCRTDGSEIFAARDPFGVKPLFFSLENVTTEMFALANEHYCFRTASLGFASEIKGLVADRIWDREGFLRQFVGLFEPVRTPFQGIIQLPPHAFLHGKKQGEEFLVSLKLKKQAIRKHGAVGWQTPSREDDLRQMFRQTFSQSVGDRTISDVELGVYLSSGIDSTVVAYELAKRQDALQAGQKLKSFTLAFAKQDYDESGPALAFAKKMNFEPRVLSLTGDDLNYSYAHAVYASENVQPYTNGSAKWWLSLFASKHVKGVLTGDGADELLCGYPSFRYANWWKFALRGRSGRTVFDKLRQTPLGESWRDQVFIKKFDFYGKDPWLFGASAPGSGEDFVESLFLWGVAHPLFGQIKAIATAVLGADKALSWLEEQGKSVASWFAFGFEDLSRDALAEPENALLLWQNYFCKTHLPVQVLNWVGDRMEMANTLEGRTPFLSGGMREFVFHHATDLTLVRGFEDKSILRRSYRELLQPYLTFLPKRQFNAPFLERSGNFQKKTGERLADLGLIDAQYTQTLFRFAESREEQEKTPPYLLSFLQSTLQTLQCFAAVDRSLVRGKVPERDKEHEARVLSRVVLAP